MPKVDRNNREKGWHKINRSKIKCAKICTGEKRVFSSSRKEDFEGKKENPFISSLTRKEKVKEAKKKKQNGDYNSEEVYGIIADRLMEIFGIR